MNYSYVVEVRIVRNDGERFKDKKKFKTLESAYEFIDLMKQVGEYYYQDIQTKLMKR
jgi:hypothetical protein